MLQIADAVLVIADHHARINKKSDQEIEDVL